ncbi:MFS transporter [Actinomadura rupiterrae]|uniref:MFS transporter n=1 Tax=Actinomadura rupiterrae TaxID=559627 RepID=UPI0020A2857E|nr:MFS transporter [Actinomadura rupiterrae]MCP2336171.1 putative MFS family arabinose efflux permease [Actinomadura rupiterrae]
MSMVTRTAEPDARPDGRVPFPLTAAAFSANFDRFAVGPILVAVVGALHVQLASAVALASGYAFAYGLSQPLWGILSDRFGRLRVIRLALVLAAVAGLASAVAPNLVVLTVLRVLAGFAFGAVVPSSISFVGDAVAPARRQAALADLMAALGLGSGLAALVAGAIGNWLSWRLVFAVPAIAATAAAVALRRATDPERAPAAGLRAQLAAVARARFAYVVTALGLVEGAVLLGGLTFVAPALQHRGLSAAAAGAITALYGAGTLAFTRAVKPLTHRVAAHWLAAIGGAFVATGYTAAAVVPGVWTYGLVATLLGAGWAFLHSTLQAWATSVVPDARGTAVSVYVAALFVGSALGAALGGGSADHGHFGTIFGVAAVATVPLTAAVVVGRRFFTASG